MPRFADYGGNQSNGHIANGWYSSNGQPYKAQVGLFYSWGNAQGARKCVRYWDDTSNWGYKGFMFEIYTNYYGTGYIDYWHNFMGFDTHHTVSRQTGSSNSFQTPTWSGETTQTGNIQHRDVTVTPTGTYRMIWGHAWVWGVPLNRNAYTSGNALYVYPSTAS